ncbi:MAG: DUF4397 domain-containing protein [Chloroflexota bacterium]
MKVLRSTPTRVLFAVLLVASLAAASFASAFAQDDDTARVRVVHASPDAPEVDVYVDGEAVVEGLAFPDGTDYLELPGGEYQVQVTAAGDDPENAVIDAPVTVEGGTWYTIAAIGQLENIEPLVLEDNITEPEMGMSHVRIVHASPDAPDVDVAVADGGPVLFEALPFGEASDYAPVEAGSYDLEVRPTGTEDVALEIPGFMAEAGAVYTVFAVGLVEDGSLNVSALVDQTFEQMEDEGEGTDEGDDAEGDEGTGSGDVPGMPETGAGGMAGNNSDSTNWSLIAILGLAVVAIGGGALYMRGSRS